MNLLNKLYNSRLTLVDMLNLREYDSEKYRNFNIDTLDTILKSIDKKNNPELNLLDLECKHKKSEKKIYVKYLLFTKSRVANIKLLIDSMIEDYVNDGDDIIFIVKDKINNINLFDDLFDNFMKNNKIFIQIFSIDCLVINISNHVLVPYHRILSEEEKEELLVKYNLDNYSQLPCIDRTDAAGKFFGIKPNDVCEIKRVSETSGIYYNYRYMN